MYSGQEIEKLQLLAGDHLFMHASQVNDWRGDLDIFVKGEGVWVNDIEGNRLLDSMAGLWYKAAGYGRRSIADAIYKQILDIDSPPAMSACIPQIELSAKVAALEAA